MILAAHEAPYTLIIEQEDDPPNPRVEWDTFGKMICWHRRYSLGDEHDFDSPEDFLRDLYRHSITDGGKQLVSFLKSGKARASKLEYNPHTREWNGICLATHTGGRFWEIQNRIGSSSSPLPNLSSTMMDGSWTTCSTPSRPMI